MSCRRVNIHVLFAWGRDGILPSGFDCWGSVDGSGRTVVHEMAYNGAWRTRTDGQWLINAANL